MTPPLSFRNSCNLEISCDEQGRDCLMVISCELVHRQSGEVHAFERVIKLQPIVEMVKRGFETYHTQLHASGDGGWLLNAAKRDAAKNAPRARGSSRHSAADSGNTVTPQMGQRGQAPASGVRERFQTPEMIEAKAEADRIAKEDKELARAMAQEDRDLARQQMLDDRENARQDAQDKRDAAYEAAHPEQMAQAYEASYQDSSDSYGDDTSNDYFAGNVARRIAMAKGVNDLWSDAHPLITGGWFDDLKGTVVKYKSYIKQGASYAAGAVATVYGGPAAGKVAMELANTCVDAAYGNEQAKAKIATATQIARSTGNANQLNVLNIAKQAAKEQTAAYHVADAAQAAKAGDPAAKAYVANLHADAQANPHDSGAQTASRIASNVSSGGSSYSEAIATMARYN